MKRIIFDKLEKWARDNNKKPLILRGARQVGKTYAVKELGRTFFNNDILVLDFEQEPALRSIFEQDLDPNRIVSELELHFGKKVVIGSTLIFMDEIQECPRALMSLKYFYEQLPELHVIVAGSLLEFISEEISFPVGRVSYCQMYPMTFFEFLVALKKENLAQVISEPARELPDIVHNDLNALLKQYFFVGGMPEAVKIFVETNSFQDSFIVHKDLVKSFRDDFPKYLPRIDRFCIDQVFLSLAKNVGQQIKYTGLADNFSITTIKKAFELLCQAQLAQKIMAINSIGIPLGASVSAKIFKSILLDVGIMQCLSSMPVDVEYSKDSLLAIYRGALAEQFVGQELRFSQEEKIYYWSRQAKSSSAEVDYVIALNGNVIPVEVKSGPSGRLRSMHMFLDKYKESPYGVVFYDGKYSYLASDKLYFYPLYYVYSFGLFFKP